MKRLGESALSVLPITIIIAILYFLPFDAIGGKELLLFLFSNVILVLGICLFNIGADLAMTPMGDYIGAGLTRSRKLIVLLLVSFIMGLLITIAEPDLTVLASQVKENINSKILIVCVGIGVGIFMLLAVVKIVLKTPLNLLLSFFYMILFALCALLLTCEKGDYLSIALDSGGVTTGPITVPFIMALGIGIANSIGGKNTKENSFGFIALCSIGPIIAVLILSLFMGGEINYIPNYELSDNFFYSYLIVLVEKCKQVAISILLIVVFFFALDIIVLRLPKSKIKIIILGIVYTYIGLVLFLTSAEIGFMPIGYKIGKAIAEYSSSVVIIVGFILGTVVVLAEPAVHVLNKQVESVTNGLVSKRTMMIALCVGVGCAIGLSVIRIVYNFSILYYIVPGYVLSLALSFCVPKLYTAIAFDSGGVASGPLTSSFILPFAIGACIFLQEGSVMQNAFGIVAMVAMAPLITIQLLGTKAIVSRDIKNKIAMKKILDASDEQIISFM